MTSMPRLFAVAPGVFGVANHAGSSRAAALGMSSETRLNAGQSTASRDAAGPTGTRQAAGSRVPPAVSVAASTMSTHCTTVRITAGASSSPRATCQPLIG